MPRDGAGIFTLAGNEAVSGQTILATQLNDVRDDLEQDANAARPIVAGGTGQATAILANDALNTTSSNLASSSTTDLATATGVVVNITGTTTITAFGTVSSGSERVLVFGGALTLTHNATSLILPGAANITTAAGDVAVMRSKGSGNWVCVGYQRASGSFLSPTSTDNAIARFDGTGGKLQNSAVTIDDNGNLTITSTAAGAAGNDITLFQDSSSPAASDVPGRVVIVGRDSAANLQTYGYLQYIIDDATSGSEDGSWHFITVVAGTPTDRMSIGATNSITGQLAGDLGLVGTPSYTFAGDLDTGMWSSGAGAIAFSCNGAETTRFTANGYFVGKTVSDFTVAGIEAFKTGFLALTTGSGNVLQINRQTDDGTLVSFLQANTSEGSISVAGTTITYGTFCGSHETMLADPKERERLLRGTIMETVDELCDWYERGGEILAKCKISDTAGSRNVYGVFFDWYDSDPEEETLNVASLGAFCVRIAKGQSVQNGDLIESNGDGCGRVQADDLMRSSTIAKITAAIPVDTYPDGSATYPCTLHCG